ncbi:MAG TPA: flagellar motor switch protein FliM [Candidatus Wunengus sp. YC60]|uniref:flagellar motor switch protein FliM n=1 Tax=Candidatus Wunengus sp. YC60 TaxID=3367697 RepID=UPI0040279667
MSNSILNNEEVEALLSAIEGGQVLVGQKIEPKREKKVQHYDFRRPDRFPREQKRRLQKISEEVAKSVGITLSRYLRTSVVVELIAIEEFSYEVFINSFTDVVCANVVNLKPLSGLGCLTIDVGFCLAIVDRGLGGPGKIPQKVRPLTMIEESVVGVVLSNIMEDIKLCWSKLAKLEWSLEKMEMDIRSLQLVPITELMISINFAISGDLGNGTVILCMPVASLEMLMIKAKLEKTDRQKEIAIIENVINEVELNATVVFGSTQLSLNELMNLRAGDVVKLDNKITEDLCLTIAGKAKHYGKPGVVGKKIAFQVS